MENNPSQKLSNKQILGYSFGAIPGLLLGFVYVVFYVEFFYDDLKLLPFYFVIGQIIYAIVNAINDPLLGQLSDRTDRKRWGGRRIPYIRYGAPIWALVFIMIWFPWSFDNQIIIFIHFVISVCAFDTMLTLVILCWMALVPEMTTDIDERNKISLVVNMIGFLGLLPFIIITPGVKAAGLQPFQMLNIIIAIISVICYLIVSFTNKEKPEFQKDEVFPLVKSIKETVKLKSFLAFIGFNFCGVFTGALGLNYLFIYVFILGGDTASATLLFLFIYMTVGYSSNFICMKLRSKWGMKKIILRYGVLKVLGSFIIFLLILDPNYDTSVVWFGVIWSTFWGGYGVFNFPVMALSMDEDEVIHGTRREGMFLGINALFTKPADSLAPITATFILTSFGYIQGASGDDLLGIILSIIQPSTALLGIKILLLLIPAIFSAISLIFMYFYPIHGARLEEIQTKLEEIHQQKRQKLTSTT